MMNFDDIKNLIDEIYINKNNNKEMQKKLMIELTKYIGNKYYKVEVDVSFPDNVKDNNPYGVYYRGEGIEYFLDNFQFLFENIDNLKDIMLIVSHELGHAYNNNQRIKAINSLRWHYDVNNLIYSIKLSKDYIEPDYNLYMNMKENFISLNESTVPGFYTRNYNKLNEENLANLNAMIVTQDMLLTFFPSLYEKYSMDLQLNYYEYLNNLRDNGRIDSENDTNSNVDIIFDELNKKNIIDNSNKLIMREYHDNLKRKNTSFLMLELYKIIMASNKKLISFQKKDILEKRKCFYIDLIVKRDMKFEDRMYDIENLINYENIFYDLDWLKNLILSWIYMDKLNKDCGYSDDEIQILKQMIVEYLKKYEKIGKSK